MIGNEILYLENIDSTNDYIKRNQLNLQDGFMVIAKEQSKGRGRFSNVWQSPKGNLYLSFLIKQIYQREKIFQLHIITSLEIR